MSAWGWIRRRDVRLAAICGVIQIVATTGAANRASHTHGCWWATACHPATPLEAGAYALLALGPLALVLRRRYVREVLAFVFAVTAAYVVRGYLLGSNFLSLGLAIVSAAFAGKRALAASAVRAGWPCSSGCRGRSGIRAGRRCWPPWPSPRGCSWRWPASRGRGRQERFAQARRARELQACRRADEERLRIAQELHDALAHNISLINVQSGVALHLMDERPSRRGSH